MNTLTEGQTPGDFLQYEEQAHYSREEGTVKMGGDYQPGTVMGQITADKKYVPYDPGAADGSETVAGVLMTNAHATDADAPKMVFLKRHAQVRRLGLLWGAGVTTSGHRDAGVAGLKALGIQVI